MATLRNRPEIISADDFGPVGFQIRDMVRRTGGSGRRFYYEARVVTGGESYPLHSIYGAWHVATGDGGIAEPEAVFGTTLGRSVKFELSSRAITAERKINDSMEQARKGRIR